MKRPERLAVWDKDCPHAMLAAWAESLYMGDSPQLVALSIVEQTGVTDAGRWPVEATALISKLLTCGYITPRQLNRAVNTCGCYLEHPQRNHVVKRNDVPSLRIVSE